MMTLTVKGKEYKVKFGYNSFCDSDLLDRTTEVMGLIDNQSVQKMGYQEAARKMFVITRELLFEGFKKENPVSSLDEVGDILDDYFEESPEGEKRGVAEIFAMITQELLTEGFFGDLLRKSEQAIEKLTKKKVNKKATNT